MGRRQPLLQATVRTNYHTSMNPPFRTEDGCSYAATGCKTVQMFCVFVAPLPQQKPGMVTTWCPVVSALEHTVMINGTSIHPFKGCASGYSLFRLLQEKAFLFQLFPTQFPQSPLLLHLEPSELTISEFLLAKMVFVRKVMR